MPRPKSEEPLRRTSVSLPESYMEVIQKLARKVGFGKLILKSILTAEFLRPWGPEVGLSEVAEKKAIQALLDEEFGREWNLRWYELWMSTLSTMAERLDGEIGDIPIPQLEMLKLQLTRILDRVESRLRKMEGERQR